MSILEPYLSQLTFINELTRHNINQFVPRKDVNAMPGGGGLPTGKGIPRSSGGALHDGNYKNEKTAIKAEIEEISEKPSKPSQDGNKSDKSDTIKLSGQKGSSSVKGETSEVKVDSSEGKHDTREGEVTVKSEVKTEVKTETQSVASVAPSSHGDFYVKITNRGKSFGSSKTKAKIPVFIEDESSTPLVFKSMRQMTTHGKTSSKRMLKGRPIKKIGESRETSFLKKKGRLFLLDKESLTSMGLSFSQF